jgi:hypothetical protein
MQFPDQFGSGPSLHDRFAQVAERGMRIARYVALSFALAVVGGIAIGAAVADNAFVQIFVTFIAGIALWPPILIAALWVDARLDRFRHRKPAAAEGVIEATAVDAAWTRLMRAAPGERDRIVAIQRSLAASHVALRDAQLDPDAHDLCVLIDRRLPELIDRELDALPPDDRGRREQVASLVELVEQFARHCGRKRDGRPDGSAYEAEVLRRRFEERLAPPQLDSQ